MLDANANRACEGLRTLEDIARFLLDDPGLVALARDARHAVRAAAGSVGLGSRDSAGDVGAGLPPSASRPDARAIVLAAGYRAAEALRVCEEVGPAVGLIDPAFARARYACYELQRSIVARLGRGCAQWSVCVLLTESRCHQPWESVAGAACEGGAGCVQLREKDLPDRELLRRARRLVALAGERGVPVVVNDRVDVALLCGAHGVHLGQGDLGPEDARRLGDRLRVGVSCSTVDQAVRAAADGADYLGLGPMFPSRTKRKPALSGPALVEGVVASAAGALPHLAISGIDASRIEALRSVGCRGVAVCEAVCGRDDPASATRALVRAMSEHAAADPGSRPGGVGDGPGPARGPASARAPDGTDAGSV